jgi:hypothetical protein
MTRSFILLALFLLASCATTTSRGNTSAAPGSAAGAQNTTYVCHGTNNPKWKKVAANAVDAHRRHGDRVTSSLARLSGPCTQ